jgi:hypothetical protein
MQFAKAHSVAEQERTFCHGAVRIVPGRYGCILCNSPN